MAFCIVIAKENRVTLSFLFLVILMFYEHNKSLSQKQIVGE